MHELHVKSAIDTEKACCGVKRQCVLSTHLSHFNVSTRYPPDIAHDLFEGILPVELAHCLYLLISKKCFTISRLNEPIEKFPYKWTDKTNRAPTVTHASMSNGSNGVIAHENWSLLRFLPFLVGHLQKHTLDSGCETSIHDGISLRVCYRQEE